MVVFLSSSVVCVWVCGVDQVCDLERATLWRFAIHAMIASRCGSSGRLRRRRVQAFGGSTAGLLRERTRDFV